jgi:hypothetical protein
VLPDRIDASRNGPSSGNRAKSGHGHEEFTSQTNLAAGSAKSFPQRIAKENRNATEQTQTSQQEPVHPGPG